MTVEETDGRQTGELAPADASGNGWTATGGRQRRGSALLGIVALAGAVAWAWHANASSGKAAMDMTMRLSSGAAPFPVAVDTVGRGTIAGTVVYTGTIVPYVEEDAFPA
jgi:multidrug efflux pump subunit AcrA (membrane-fusion protein)